LYFAELSVLPSNAVRMLSVTMDNVLFFNSYQPSYRLAGTTYTSDPFYFSNRYNFSIKAVMPNSTLPPVINAAEFFSVISTANVGTFTRDGKYGYYIHIFLQMIIIIFVYNWMKKLPLQK
jgi:hypothetical protein